MSRILFWVDRSEWGCMEQYFGRVGVSGALFWVGWGWVGKHFGWMGVSGGGWR